MDVRNDLIWAKLDAAPDGATNNNIDVDPNFANPALEDYRLSAASPCIDTGDSPSVPADLGDVDDNAIANEPTPLDVELRSRFVAGALVPGQVNACDGVVNVGAHEFAYDCDDCIHMGDINYDGMIDGAGIQPFVACSLSQDEGCVTPEPCELEGEPRAGLRREWHPRLLRHCRGIGRGRE